ncbi:MAG: flagellar export protein FliJ [Treponema sp.]|nr:flagellar export protein FliJ [Treponema sp.]
MAKAFKFELQDVLDFRNFEQEQAQNELAKALAVETQINNQLQNIAAQFVSVRKQIDSFSDFEDIAAGNRRKVLLESQKEELLKQLAEAKLVSEEKRAVLAEAMKKTTALEKLKEKQLEDWKAESDKEENDFIDDLSNSGKHFRQ